MLDLTQVSFILGEETDYIIRFNGTLNSDLLPGLLLINDVKALP